MFARPPMVVKPRRLISFKHWEPDEGPMNNIDDEDGPEPEESVDDFKQLLFDKAKSKKRKYHASDDIDQEDPGKVRRTRMQDAPDPEDNVLICDNAADQCVVGQGFKVLFHTGQSIRMDGAMAGMTGNKYPIVCAVAVVEDETTFLPKMIIINQAAYNPDIDQHESLLHTEQARLHGVKVNDLASFLTDGYGNNGKQCLEMEGITIPLRYDGSKYFLRVREPTEKELEELPAFEITSPIPWQPREQLKTMRRTKKGESWSAEELKDWSQRMGSIPEDVVKKTLEATTQFVNTVEAETRTTPRRHFKVRLPSLRPKRLVEGFHTDTFFSDCKSLTGFKCAQVFVGATSGYTYVVPMKGKGYAFDALKSFISDVGAPAFLLTDNAYEEVRGEWEEICKTYCISQIATEPHYQHQNKAERRIQDIKRQARVLMRINRAPKRYWDMAVMLAVDQMNHTASRKLQWKTPHEILWGETPDISVFRFVFYEEIYFLDPATKFPNPNMLPGRFLGIARTTGDSFTFYIEARSPKGQPIILIRSVIQRRDPKDLAPIAIYDDMEEVVTIEEEVTQDDKADTQGDPFTPEPSLEEILAGLDSEELILGDTVASYDGTMENGDVILHLGDGSQTTMNTTDVVNHLNQDSDTEEIDSIVGHDWGPISGKLLMKVKWYTGETSLLDADVLREDCPSMLAKYIIENPIERTRHGFWNQWAQQTIKDIHLTVRRLRSMFVGGTDIADLPFRMARRLSKRKKKSHMSHEPTVQFGVPVPRNVKEAHEMDKQNGDNRWKEAIEKEMKGLHDHQTFKFLDPKTNPPAGYQFAPLRMVFAVKPDGRRKARLVIGGHVVDSSEHSGYSSVVKLTSIRLLNIIAKNESLECLAGDVGNAYLHALTKEKVYVRCGLEFGEEFKDRIAIVVKSLYGLKSSGNRWHSHFANTLYSMGFKPTRYDHDVWYKLRDDESGYDYISTYVDDFLITAKDAWSYMKHLQSIYTIKEPKHPEVYLGALYTGSPEGNWSISCKNYIKEAIMKIEKVTGSLRLEKSPMVTGDHPEEDESDMLDMESQRFYQQMMGMAVWLVQLGRLDICFAVASLSRFLCCPRDGHLKRLKRVWGYLKKFPNKAIGIVAEAPVFEVPLEKFEADFEDQYKDAYEEIDPAVPIPKGKPLCTSIFFDSDHAHDKKTRKSITGVLVVVGSTPVSWMSKRQGAVATSSYGAEFCAMRTATEEAVSIRYTLRSLGIPVNEPTKLFGDNLGVIQNASMPEANLVKKHIAIAFHFVRECVAAKIIAPYKISGKDNFADVFTKALDITTFKYHAWDLLWHTPTRR